MAGPHSLNIQHQSYARIKIIFYDDDRKLNLFYCFCHLNVKQRAEIKSAHSPNEKVSPLVLSEF